MCACAVRACVKGLVGREKVLKVVGRLWGRGGTKDLRERHYYYYYYDGYYYY
jgi:hypothetical protein